MKDDVLFLDVDTFLKSIKDDLADAAITIEYPIGVIHGRQIQIVVTRDPDRFLPPAPDFACIREEF